MVRPPNGRSDSPGVSFDQRWTVREVTPNGHGRCGMLHEAKSEVFLNEIARAMDLTPDIRIAGGEEMRESADRIEIFPAEYQMTPPEIVLVIAATYKVISLHKGDTAGLPPSAVMQIYEEGGEPIKRAVEAILRDAQQQGFEQQQGLKAAPTTRKRWWQIWR